MIKIKKLIFLFCSVVVGVHLPEIAFAFKEEANPFMQSAAANSMHNDSANSDVHEFKGPQNQKTNVKYFKYARIFGLCPAFGYDSKGRIVTVCVKALKTKLYVLEPRSLKVLGSIDLPGRKDVLPALTSFQFGKLLKDTSGGAYFYIDHEDRVVVPSPDRRILIIKSTEIKKDTVELKIERELDLNLVISHKKCPSIAHPVFGNAECDKLTAVMPDWQGRYWFTSRYGVIGLVNAQTNEVKAMKIPEEIQNSFAVSRDGVYILSDHALYRFSANSNNQIEMIWRETYDRGHRTKPGQINKGSGTTPTLFGGRYVAIADNADPYMHALIYDRLGETSKDRLLCKESVFQAGKGADENSFIGYDHSIIVSNSYGYRHPFTVNDPQPGMVRIDVDPETKSCKVIWKNDVVLPVSATPKLSLGTGLIYVYSHDPQQRVFQKRQWFVGGIDFNTGKLVYRSNTKKGLRYDNFWGTISIAPDSSLLVGALQGFLKISDEN